MDVVAGIVSPPTGPSRPAAALRLLLAAPALALLVSASVGADTGSPPTDVGVGHASPLRAISALPLEFGETSIFFGVQYLEFNAFSDAELLGSVSVPGDVDSTNASWEAALGISFGATDNLTLTLGLPWVWNVDIREPQETGEPGNRSTEVVSLGSSTGLGDLVLLAQYRFFHDPAQQAHLAVLGGVKTPTGLTNVRTRQGELFGTDHQPGSGSWDGLFGLAATRFWGKASLDASLFYKRTSEGAQDTRLGDGMLLGLALSYRLAEGYLAPDLESFVTNKPWWDWFSWDAVMEVETGWSGKDVTGGVSDPNSGGLVVALSPGFRASPGRGWDATLSFDFPVYTNLNGTQVEPRWGVLATIGRSY